MKEILAPIILFCLFLAVIGFLKQASYFASIGILGPSTIFPDIKAVYERFIKGREAIRVNIHGGGLSVGIEAVKKGRQTLIYLQGN